MRRLLFTMLLLCVLAARGEEHPVPLDAAWTLPDGARLTPAGTLEILVPVWCSPPARRSFLDHFFIFQKNSLHLKMANFSSLKRRSIFTSRKILREKLELHSASKKSLNIAKMVEKRFELPVSTHDLAYEKIRLADCHKIPIFSDKSENPHVRVTGVHKFLTFTPPSVPVDNREASHQEMKPL